MISKSLHARYASCWIASVAIHVFVGGALTVLAQRDSGAASPRVARDVHIWIARSEANAMLPLSVEPSRELELPELEDPRVVPMPEVDSVPPEASADQPTRAPDPHPLAEAANAWTAGWDRPFARIDPSPDRELELDESSVDPVAASTPAIRHTPPAAPAAASAAESAPARQDVLLRAPPPAYPRVALRLRLQGTVLCRLSVRADGSVERVDVVESSGHSVLDHAAATALLQWLFEPSTRIASDPEREVLHAVTFQIPRG